MLAATDQNAFVESGKPARPKLNRLARRASPVGDEVVEVKFPRNPKTTYGKYVETSEADMEHSRKMLGDIHNYDTDVVGMPLSVCREDYKEEQLRRQLMVRRVHVSANHPDAALFRTTFGRDITDKEREIMILFEMERNVNIADDKPATLRDLIDGTADVVTAITDDTIEGDTNDIHFQVVDGDELRRQHPPHPNGAGRVKTSWEQSA